MTVPDRARVAPPWSWYLAAVGVSLLAAAAGLAVVHIGDRYALTSSSSVWMGLAEYASRGVLFPPIVDGDYYAGTRYMPLPVIGHALLAGLTGEYLMAGKVLGLLSTIGLGALLIVVLRQQVVGWAIPITLVALVLASPVGMVATTAMRPEAIPTGLQLAAVALVSRSTGRRTLVAAAGLAMLAVTAKLSAGYAAVAIVVWLLARDRRAAATFGVSLLVCAVVTVIVLDRATDGRIWTNLFELGAGVPSLTEVLSVPSSLAAHVSASPSVALLLPFVIAWYMVARRVRRLSIYHLAGLVALAIVVVLYTDQGVWYNHLLDVFVLIAVLAAQAWAWARKADVAEDALRLSMAAAMVAGAIAALATGPGIDLALAGRHLATSPGVPMYDPHFLDAYLADDDLMLADDASLPLTYGQRPYVLDSFMLKRIGDLDPSAIDGLVRRIVNREFPHVVLQFDIEDPSSGVFAGPHELGAALDTAIRENYRSIGIVRMPSLSYGTTVPESHVYVPR